MLAVAALPRQPETRPGRDRGGDAAAAAREAARNIQEEDAEALKKPGGESIERPYILPSEESGKRDFKITQPMLIDLGRSDGCAGCRDAFQPGGSRQQHSAACRQRLEEAMRGNPKYSRRLEERDRRHGLAPPE